MSSSFIAYIVSRDQLVKLGENWGVRACQEGPDALAHETANVILGSLPPTSYVRLRDGTITENGTTGKQICHIFALGKRDTTIDRIPSELLEQLNELFDRKPQTFIREKNARRWYDGSQELWAGDTLTYVK